MRLIADLHIHSKYSRATSRDCVPEVLELWARRKGIDLLGTGDFTHPIWREELREKLEPAEEGLYILKEAYRQEGPSARPRFVVTGEISSIYKKGGRVRKIHNLILLPGLDQAEALSRRLEAIGNIHSDGRPILGLDSRDLLEITLEVCPSAIFIPAHIWTPHFSLFGAFSGFDTMEECFGDLTPHIHAVETGLSSDPPMNWRLSALDSYALVSNSDAHSPSKLGREANLLDIDLSYPALAEALNGRSSDQGLLGTIEFFPEEGKYHYDGHRNCKCCLAPSEAEAFSGICPVCGGKLTVGVLHRVETLADRDEGYRPAQPVPFESLIPLPEVIAGSTGYAPTCQKVLHQYNQLLRELGSEFEILRQVPPEEIERLAGPCVAEGIRRMRSGTVDAAPGYDGEYGKIKLLDPSEMDLLQGQLFLLGAEPGGIRPKPIREKRPGKAPGAKKKEAAPAPELQLNQEQQAAVLAPQTAVSVIAGPGTGKTKTLVARVIHLIEDCGISPAEITAVTFTNQAAGEMRARLEAHFGKKRSLKRLTIGTFHSICLNLLSKDGPITVLDEFEARAVAEEILAKLPISPSPRRLLQEISRHKNGILPLEEARLLTPALLEAYTQALREYGALDYDDLLLEALQRSEGEKPPRAFRHLLVDELQDINDLQYRLIRAWAGEDLFVIGDPLQSIYGFRGADIHCFDRFYQDYPQALRIRLTKNYRSTPEILGCALPLIRTQMPELTLEPQSPSGAPVRLLTAQDDFSEALFLAKEINRMVGGIDMLDAQAKRFQRTDQLRSFSDVAVLYRTHRQAELIEFCLKKEGIPYVVAGRDKLLAEPSVRGTAGFFRHLLNPADRLSLRTCLKALFRCSNSQLEVLTEHYEPTLLEAASLPSELAAIPGIQRWWSLAQAYLPRLSLEQPAALLEDWRTAIEPESAPLEQLVHMAVCYDSLSAFLGNLALGQERDVSRSGSRTYLSNAVSLMTFHGAKGLEFPVVFLCGLKEGTLPLENPGRTTDIEEERRLLYVGVTRAQEELVLLASESPSPFLEALPQTACERGAAAEPRRPAAAKQLSLFD